MNFSMALIASLELNKNNQRTYQLRKAVSVQVTDVTKNEIDDALQECLEKTPELEEFDLAVFIGDGDLDADIIAPHRVYFYQRGELVNRIIITHRTKEEQHALCEVFFYLLEDLNNELAD